MGSKKYRNKEKKEAKKVMVEEEQAKIKKRKGTALLNMGAIISLLLIIFLGNVMSGTINVSFDKDATDILLKNELKIENPDSFGSAEADNKVYIGYKANNKIGIAEASRHTFLYNRYNLTKDFKTMDKNLAYVTNNIADREKSYVVVYGDLTDTLASYAEVTFNGETKKIDFEERTTFVNSVEFNYADISTATVKIFDKDGKDITSEL